MSSHDDLYPVKVLCPQCQAFFTSDEHKPKDFELKYTEEVSGDLLKDREGCDLCNGTAIPPVPQSEV